MKYLAIHLCLLIIILANTVLAQYKFYQTGFELYKQQKYKEAAASFSEFLNKPGREKALDVEVYYLRGLSYFKLGDYKQSVADLQQSAGLGHSNQGNIYWFMAKANSKMGYHFESIKAYDEAIRLLSSDKDNLVKLYCERSLLYIEVEKRPLAYADLYRAYEIQPTNEQVQANLKLFSASEVETFRVTMNPQANATVREANTQLADLYKDEKRFALVIGNAQYPREVGELKNPVNDAIDMAAELRASNFDVQLLTNATYGQMRAELQKFKEKLEAGPADKTVGLFYFAGHGLRQDQENYLVPVDAKIEFEDDIWRYCFPVQRMVLANMERSNARLNIVILDACRNNPFPSLTRSLGNQGLVEMQKARGSFIAFATAPGSVAIDGTGRNGLYTQEVLKAMRIPGLTIEQVFKEVRKNVMVLSGNRQNTWDNSNIVGEFYFKF
ncbi:MAG: caspase family protein [Cyclobacteriaceae bacterium]|nr:caspase family protein [Cyclobacteriaceae bacterium]